MDNKQLGDFVRQVREYNFIKQEMLALDANVSRSVISKLENGSNEINDQTFATVFAILNLDIDEYESNKEFMSKCLETIYKSIVYGNNNYIPALTNIRKRVEDNFYLKFYPGYKIITLIDAFISGKKTEFNTILNECNSYIDLFNEYECAIYNDFIAINFLEENDFKHSLEILNEINLFDLPDYLCGMIEYHIGTNYHHMMNFYMSVRHLESAINYFVTAQNFNKIIYTQMIISDAYFKTGNYDLAIETLEKSLDAAYSIPNNNVLGMINRNIAWFSLVKGDYNKTINHVQQALLYDNTKCESYFYLVYSYFRLCDTNKALHYVELAEEHCDENHLDYKMCVAIKKIIKNSKTQIAYLENLYESIDMKLNPIYKQLVLEFMMSYYKRIDDYENLAHCSVELNKILSKKLLMFEH